MVSNIIIILILTILTIAVIILVSWNIILRNKLKKGDAVKNTSHYGDLLGLEGIAVTDMRLAGKIRVNDVTYQAVSKDEYINSNQKIKIIKVESNNIIVEKI